MSLVFGPIPSRRLGRSLGINHLPRKACSYSCVYCQVGITNAMSIERKEYYSPDRVLNEVSKKISMLRKSGEPVDYITFVPDGEPTLDINLGKIIDKLKPFEYKVAVITNSSLLWDKTTRKDLSQADWVSVKLDSVYENIWHKINRPHGQLTLQKIIEGINEFSCEYKGILATETMLAAGINDNIESLSKTAQVIAGINPDISYILVPTRPPAEKTAGVPSSENIDTAYQIFSSLIGNVNLIISNEGNNFSFSSDAVSELLSILAIHPMRKDAVQEFLIKAESGWELIDNLIKQRILAESRYNGNIYFKKI